MELSQQDQETLQRMCDDLSNAGDANIVLRTNYSGRNMHGELCVGFDIHGMTTWEAAIKIMQWLQKTEESELLDSIIDSEVNEESLGEGVIVYFPSIKPHVPLHVGNTVKVRWNEHQTFTAVTAVVEDGKVGPDVMKEIICKKGTESRLEIIWHSMKEGKEFISVIFSDGEVVTDIPVTSFTKIYR